MDEKIKVKLRFNKAFFAIVTLILVATTIQIPFLMNNFAPLDSDDAISALMAKHISEGKQPPFYQYRQVHGGAFAHHIYALVFKISGYSIFVIVLLYFTFYLGFIMTQFLFFKEIFSSYNLSLVLSLFYCLPIGDLLAVNTFVSTNYSVILFLGSLSVYFSFLVYKKNKQNLIPLIGFCLGLSFWVQFIAISFAISAFILIALRFKLILRKYFVLIFYFLIGSFPVILYEISHKLITFNYLFSGTKIQDGLFAKIKTIIGNIIFLISAESNFLSFIYILLIFLGIIVIIYLSLKRRKFLPENIFVIFFIVHIAVYTFSKFGADLWKIRYLYPLYFALPFLLVSIFNLIRKKIKYVVMLTLFLVILVFNNIRETQANYLLVKRGHSHLKKIIHTMEMTGERYWAGNFWNVILITALSGEKIIGYAYNYEEYFPYRLVYFNQGDNNNYVFFKELGSTAVKYKQELQENIKNYDLFFDQSKNLVQLLERLNVKAKVERIGDYCLLIYDIRAQVFPLTIQAPIPQQIPEIELEKIESSKAYLSLIFRNKTISEDSGFRLHFGIPGYSSKVKGFSLENEEIKMRIPFPRKKSFRIKYYLDYMGIKIPSTAKEVSFSPSPRHLRKRKKEVVYLSGFGPEARVSDEKMKICEKEAKFEINKKLQEESRVRLHLYSPFQFSHPYWYGEYFQEVKIYVNDRYLTEKRLEDGENIIELEMRGTQLKKRANFITLKFKYHLPFKFARLWKTAALLDKIEVD